MRWLGADRSSPNPSPMAAAVVLWGWPARPGLGPTARWRQVARVALAAERERQRQAERELLAAGAVLFR